MTAKRKRTKPVHVARAGNVRVPIYRYGDGRFCVAWRKVAGEAPRRETFSVRKEAEARAEEMALAIANGQADVLELTRADRDSYLLAVRQVQTFGIPLHSAIEEWAAVRQLAASAGVSPIEALNLFIRGRKTSVIAPPTAQILDELLAQLDDRQPSAKYRRELKSDLTRFAAAFPDLAQVTEKEIREHLRGLRSRGGAPVGLRRRDNVRDAIVRLSRFARRRGYLAEDKISPAEKIETVSTGGEVTTYTPSLLATLIEHVPHEWRPWMAIAAFAGMRTSEIFRLQWSDVKWGHKVIAVRRSVAKKVRVARMVPMTDMLVAWLAPWREAQGPLYRPEPSWRALENRHERAINAIERATGIQWEANALRHSFGSHRLALVKSIDQVALEMGNSPAKVREHYHDPKTEGEAKAYFGILPPELSADNILPLALEFR